MWKRNNFFCLEHSKKAKERKNSIGPTKKKLSVAIWAESLKKQLLFEKSKTPLLLLFFIYVTILCFFS